MSAQVLVRVLGLGLKDEGVCVGMMVDGGLGLVAMGFVGGVRGSRLLGVHWFC